MRSSLVIRASDCQYRSTVLGSIPASSDTVESERRQMKQVWIQYIEKNPRNPPLLQSAKFSCEPSHSLSFLYSIFAAPDTFELTASCTEPAVESSRPSLLVPSLLLLLLLPHHAVVHDAVGLLPVISLPRLHTGGGEGGRGKASENQTDSQLYCRHREAEGHRKQPLIPVLPRLRVVGEEGQGRACFVLWLKFESTIQLLVYKICTQATERHAGPVF